MNLQERIKQSEHHCREAYSRHQDLRELETHQTLREAIRAGKAEIQLHVRSREAPYHQTTFQMGRTAIEAAPEIANELKAVALILLREDDSDDGDDESYYVCDLPWIGVDLDGTLAEYHSGDFDKYGPLHIGAPIPDMVARVKGWLAEGKKVKIFTARVFQEMSAPEEEMQEFPIRDAIMGWCERHIGRILPVTCVKDHNMTELWDDRVVQVIRNTGRAIGRRRDAKLSTKAAFEAAAAICDQEELIDAGLIDIEYEYEEPVRKLKPEILEALEASKPQSDVLLEWNLAEHSDEPHVIKNKITGYFYHSGRGRGSKWTKDMSVATAGSFVELDRIRQELIESDVCEIVPVNYISEALSMFLAKSDDELPF